MRAVRFRELRSLRAVRTFQEIRSLRAVRFQELRSLRAVRTFQEMRLLQEMCSPQERGLHINPEIPLQAVRNLPVEISPVFQDTGCCEYPV